MNHTFKIVFNHARGCMVAVNEISHSLQKKGTKSLIATAVSAALLGFGTHAQAANTGGVSFTDWQYVSSYGNNTNNSNGTVVIDTTLTNTKVYGAYAYSREFDGSETFSNNSVTISQAVSVKDVYGSRAYYFYASGDSDVGVVASSNKVTVNSQDTTNVVNFGQLFGASAVVSNNVSPMGVRNQVTSEVADNTVGIENSKVVGTIILGGHANANGTKSSETTAKGNKVNFSKSIVSLNGTGSAQGTDTSILASVHAGYASTYGNETATSTASDNHVTVTESSVTVSGTIYGSTAIAETYTNGIANAKAEKSDVTISGSSEQFTSNLTGGYAYAHSVWANTQVSAVATENEVKLSDFKPATSSVAYIYGGRTLTNVDAVTSQQKAEATNNTVEIENSSFSGESIYGSYAQAKPNTKDSSATATASNNEITVSNSLFFGSYLYGSNALVNGSATGAEAHAIAKENSVSISGESTIVGTVYGGRAYFNVGNKGDATVSDNHVTVSETSTVKGLIYGGYARLNKTQEVETIVTDNTVEISGATVEDTIYGGYSRAQATSADATSNATVSGNAIKIYAGSNIQGNVIGGVADTQWEGTLSASQAVTKNTVYVDGATIAKDTYIAGGYLWLNDSSLSKTNSATDNSVELTGNFSIDGVSLYGGMVSASSVSGIDVFTGNTLKLDARKVSSVSVKNVANFETIVLQAGDVQADSVVLATESTTLGVEGDTTKGTSVTITNVGAASELHENEKIILISNASGTLSNEGEKVFIYKGDSTVNGYDATIKLEDSNVIAVIEGETIAPEPTPVTPDASENAQAKVFTEAFVANLAFINHGTDILLDVNEQSGPTFGAIAGGHKRYKTGSYADVDGVNLATGLAHTFKRQSTDTTMGVFVETAYGDITTHNAIGGAKQKGDGTSKYVGGGLLARFDVSEGSLKGLYTRLALRAGRLFTDYTNKDVYNGVSYDLDSNYYAGHIGLGYQRNLTNAIQLDTRAQYMFSRIEGKDLTIENDTYHFKDTDSHRVRVGMRFNYIANPRVNPFVSFAWEHEFDGKVKSTRNGVAFEGADLTGSSGIVKMGLTVKPSKESRFSLDAGVAGYFGVQEGIHGEIRMKYLF